MSCWVAGAALALGLGLLAACGGGGDSGGAAGGGGSAGGGTTATAPTITTQPADASVTAPATATFSVMTSGSPAPTYQWQASIDGGVSFADIAGATAAAYTLTTTPADNGKRLRVTVSNSAGSVSSRAAALVVTAPATQRFMYLNDVSGGPTIEGYAISSATGALTAVPGSPYSPVVGAFSNGLAFHPSRPFAYAAFSGSLGGIFGYAVDPASGRLTPLSASRLTTVWTNQVEVHPNGRFLFASRGGGGIESHRIDAATGLLQPVPGSPFAVGNSGGFVLDPAGRRAYQISFDSNSVARLHVWSIDADTGVLAPATGSPYALPTGASYAAPVVHPRGGFVYVPSYNYKLFAFAVAAGSGALTPLPGSPYTISTLTAGGLPPTVVFDPTGKFLYLDIRQYALGSVARGLYGYAVDLAGGALTPVAGGPFGTPVNGNSPACGLAAGGAGHLLQSGMGIASLTIDPGTGVLGVAAVSTLNVGGGCSVALEPNGTFAYVIGPQAIWGYRFDASTGSLTALSNPLAGGATPSWLVFR